MVDSAVDVEDERTIRVFILDDHELVRRGLTDLLGSTDDMKVVGEAANARETLFAAVMAGAPGYLLKQIGGSSLVDGICQVAAGRSLVDSAVTRKMLERIRHPVEPDPVANNLTAREREILGLIADGYTNRQIGERVFLAEKTVKNYVSALLAKLGMQRRTQAAVYGASLKRPTYQ